jgi:hypothetical protein
MTLGSRIIPFSGVVTLLFLIVPAKPSLDVFFFERLEPIPLLRYSIPFIKWLFERIPVTVADEVLAGSMPEVLFPKPPCK